MARAFTPERREQLSTRMKAHWTKCIVIGEFLGQDKQTINRAYQDLVKFGFAEKLLDCTVRDESLKADVNKFLSEQYKSVPQPKLFDASEGVAENITMPAASISCAMWFIKKIGDIDEAERIMKIAIKACREYSK